MPPRCAAIVAPAGQPIGAQTPEEIALSVLAAVVAARRRRTDAAGTAPPRRAPRPSRRCPISAPVRGSCCGG